MTPLFWEIMVVKLLPNAGMLGSKTLLITQNTRSHEVHVLGSLIETQEWVRAKHWDSTKNLKKTLKIHYTLEYVMEKHLGSSVSFVSIIESISQIEVWWTSGLEFWNWCSIYNGKTYDPLGNVSYNSINFVCLKKNAAQCPTGKFSLSVRVLAKFSVCLPIAAM